VERGNAAAIKKAQHLPYLVWLHVCCLLNRRAWTLARRSFPSGLCILAHATESKF